MKYNFRLKPLAVSIGLSLVLTHTAFAAEDNLEIDIVNGKAENSKGKIAQIKAEAESADQYIIDLINNITLTPGPQGDTGAKGDTGPAGADAAAGEVYYWGDTGPDDGIVFYVDGSGQHGLEAQVGDYNNGEDPSLIWLAAIEAAASYNTTVITVELDCSTTIFPSTSNCWHLPSKLELQYLYEQHNVVGGFASSIYWSSTQGNSITAWSQIFTNGSQYSSSKGDAKGVRAVRAF